MDEYGFDWDFDEEQNNFGLPSDLRDVRRSHVGACSAKRKLSPTQPFEDVTPKGVQHEDV
jgi:hypothetical protein